MEPITLGLIALGGIVLYSINSTSKKPDVIIEPKPDIKPIEKIVLTSLNDASNIIVPPLEQWASVKHKENYYLVSPRYIAPVGIAEALKIAQSHGLELPTPEMVNDIWKAADLKLEPHPRGPNSIPPSDFTMKTMNSDATNIAQLAYIQNQIAGRDYKLLGGTHKDVVMKDGKLGIYGWHKLDGKPIQDFFTGHAGDWKDYSQGLRLVKKISVVA